MKGCYTYEMPSPTATAVVGLSHRGSRVETHAAAANRKIRRREASQCGQPYSGPLGVFAMVEKENGAESIHYVLKDNLGSWTTITDANGNVVCEQSFDAWGNARNPETWSGDYNTMPMFNRGFTGHEHLMFGKLINMNGRMYDPVMSSFLSVDNYVQAPDFSQSFNRYAYCLNNPLRYVDPDGEWFLTGGVGFGKREDGYGLTSVSVGVNFGYFGFGVNLGFDNRGFSSFGVYGELGPHVGSAGANLTLSVGYDFRYQTTTASLSAGYGFSYGVGRAGVGASASYTWGGPSGMSPWNANVSASLGLAWSVNKFGQMAGLGIACSYGTQGWGFGAHSYCEILPAQEKLNRIVSYYADELAAIGEADATVKALSMVYDENGNACFGHTQSGRMKRIIQETDGVLSVDLIYCGNEIQISKSHVRKMWRGNEEAIETLFHEWKHGVQLHSGHTGKLLQQYNNNFALVADLMEYEAYMFDYSRIHTTYRYNRMLFYGFERGSLLDAILINLGLSPKYH